MNQEKAELFAHETLKTLVDLEVNMVVSQQKNTELKMKETADNIGLLYRHLLRVYQSEG